MKREKKEKPRCISVVFSSDAKKVALTEKAVAEFLKRVSEKK